MCTIARACVHTGHISVEEPSGSSLSLFGGRGFWVVARRDRLGRDFFAPRGKMRSVLMESSIVSNGFPWSPFTGPEPFLYLVFTRRAVTSTKSTKTAQHPRCKIDGVENVCLSRGSQFSRICSLFHRHNKLFLRSKGSVAARSGNNCPATVRAKERTVVLPTGSDVTDGEAFKHRESNRCL